MKSEKGYPFVPTFAAAALAILILCPLRIYQYFNVLEPETGFYSKTDFSVYVMYAVIALLVIFSIATAFINKKNLKHKGINLSPATGAIAYLLCAVGFGADAFKCFTDYLAIGESYTPSFGQTEAQYASQEGSTFIIIEAAFAVISAIYFLVLAFGHIGKKNVAPKLKLIALALPAWAVVRILLKFKTKISFINVSDLFITLFALAFTMLYLLYFAQTVSEVDEGLTYHKLFAYGIPAAVLSLTCFIPRFVLLVVGRGDLICPEYGVEPCELLIPIMIIATLIARTYDSKKADKE